MYTDIPPRSFNATVQSAGVEASCHGVREPDIEGLAEALYGPARYVVTSKGRSAEFTLVAALEKKGATVIGHGMFKTTERSLLRAEAKIEIAPRTPADDGKADIDLKWLDARLAAGGVDYVYVEPSNNQLAGWVMTLDNMQAIKRSCERHGALLLLDAARLLGNCAALGGGPLLDLARAFVAAADAFTVPAAKELLVPSGALVGVRSIEQQRRAFQFAFFGGFLLEPLDARVRLATGLAHVTAHPEVFANRREQLLELAGMLRARGVPFIEPVGGHAVWVVVDDLIGQRPGRAHGLEALLYKVGGVRAWLSKNAILQRHLLRLIIAPGRWQTQDLTRVADAVKTMFDRASEAQNLVAQPGTQLSDLYMRFAPAAE